MNEVDSPHMKTSSWNTGGYQMYDHSQSVMPSTQYQGFTTINQLQSDVLNASFNHDYFLLAYSSSKQYSGQRD